MDKTSAAGWVVQLTIPVKSPESNLWRGPVVDSAPSFQFFNVAVASADKAVEVARKKAGADDDALLRVVRQLSSDEVAHIKLREGEVKPA